MISAFSSETLSPSAARLMVLMFNPVFSHIALPFPCGAKSFFNCLICGGGIGLYRLSKFIINVDIDLVIQI